MARSKNMDLEVARDLGKLDQFAKEHPSEGDEDRWDELFEAMVKGTAGSEKPPRPGSVKK